MKQRPSIYYSAELTEASLADQPPSSTNNGVSSSTVWSAKSARLSVQMLSKNSAWARLSEQEALQDVATQVF